MSSVAFQGYETEEATADVHVYVDQSNDQDNVYIIICEANEDECARKVWWQEPIGAQACRTLLENGGSCESNHVLAFYLNMFLEPKFFTKPSLEVFGLMNNSTRSVATNHYSLELTAVNADGTVLQDKVMQLPISAANRPVSLTFTIQDGFGSVATEDLRAEIVA